MLLAAANEDVPRCACSPSFYSQIYVVSVWRNDDEKEQNEHRASSSEFVVPLVKTLMLLKIFVNMQVQLNERLFVCTKPSCACPSLTAHR